MSLLDEIPGYRQAIEAEEAIREESYLLPHVMLCGIECEHIKLPHMSILFSINSPFLCGGEIEPHDVALFLWIVSCEFGLKRETWIQRWRKERFIRKCGNLPYDQSVAEIKRFCSDTFQDTSSGSRPFNKAPAACFIAYVCHYLAKEYGWTDDHICSIPMKRIYQYLRLIKLDANPKAIIFNASDRVKTEFLNQINSRN